MIIIGAGLALFTLVTGRVDGSGKTHEKCIKRLLNDPEVNEFTF